MLLNSKYQQQAMSLVSLTIASALSGFLILVLLQLFSVSQANNKINENIAAMNDIERFAITMLKNIISGAGYRYNLANEYDDAFYGENGAVLAAYVDTVAPNYYADQIKVYFDSNNEIAVSHNCSGQLLASNQSNAENHTHTVELYAEDNGNGNINYKCTDKVLDRTNSFQVLSSSTQTLIDKENFAYVMIRWGEDINDDGNIDRWVPGYNVFDFKRIYAVRLALVIKSKEDVFPQTKSYNFNIFDKNISYYSRKIYKLSTFTIHIKHNQRP